MAKILSLSRFGSKKDLSNQEFKCVIRLLDDEEVLQVDFQREHKGQFLLDYVFKTLNLLEKDYFGLRFVDPNNQRTWLDPTRSILKQVKGLNPIIFCFRIKFYPANPLQLKEELTRYYLYLQLRRDILNRRLYCLSSDATYLIACVIQSEMGDYDPDVHKGNYISDIKLIPNQNEEMEFEAIKVHQNELRNQTPAEAELRFLERAAKLDTYGIDPHPVKDQSKNPLFIGINFSGLIVFQGNRKLFHYKWSELQKITYEGRMFIIHYHSNGKKNLIGFKCPNMAACQNLWRGAVEQRYFFTMNSSLEIPTVTTGGGLFSKQCKLRYSGRVEREIIEDMKKVNSTGQSINRRHSINSNIPLTMRSIGRSNTAPLPNNESPDFSSSIYQDKNPYLNYSTVSEPHGPHSNMNSSIKIIESSDSVPALQNMSHNNPIVLEKFDEEEWETSINSSLPTEFDLRPDLTPTGDEPNTISFETPIVRSSPSTRHHNNNNSPLTTETTTDDDSDETLEQVSEIVDQTPSTIQPKREIGGKLKNSSDSNKRQATKRTMSLGKRMLAMVCTSILSAFLIVLILTCLLIIVLETETNVFNDIRKLPEMDLFNRDYYQPFKKNIIDIAQKNWKDLNLEKYLNDIKLKFQQTNK